MALYLTASYSTMCEILMKFISPLHVRNPFLAIRPIVRRGFLLSALGAFLLTGASGWADLGTALNAPYLTWYTGGNANWYGQSLITHDGSAAAQSGLMGGNNMSSRLNTTVTGSGTFSFWWKVWSEQNHDNLLFYINDVEQMRTSGVSNWAVSSFIVGAGTHTFKWLYSKDGSGSYGLDAGWGDE